jgi:hypothetical protein
MIRTAFIRPSLAIAVILLCTASACGSAGKHPTSSTTTDAVTAAAPSPISPPLGSTATPSVGVTGLFADPRAAPEIAASRPLGPRMSSFGPWDRISTMVYDLSSHTETNLGPGDVGRFSPDSTKMVWTASTPPGGNGEVWMIDLTTMAMRDLGPGMLAAFVDGTHIGIAGEVGNEAESLDLTTGARAPLPGGVASLFPDPSVT